MTTVDLRPDVLFGPHEEGCAFAADKHSLILDTAHCSGCRRRLDAQLLHRPKGAGDRCTQCGLEVVREVKRFRTRRGRGFSTIVTAKHRGRS
jgi:hypothetical protein